MVVSSQKWVSEWSVEAESGSHQACPCSEQKGGTKVFHSVHSAPKGDTIVYSLCSVVWWSVWPAKTIALTLNTHTDDKFTFTFKCKVCTVSEWVSSWRNERTNEGAFSDPSLTIDCPTLHLDFWQTIKIQNKKIESLWKRLIFNKCMTFLCVLTLWSSDDFFAYFNFSLWHWHYKHVMMNGRKCWSAIFFIVFLPITSILFFYRVGKNKSSIWAKFSVGSEEDKDRQTVRWNRSLAQ